MLDERNAAKLRGAAPGRHAAVAKRRVAYGVDRGAGGCGIADMRHLDTLHAYIQQSEDEGRIKAWCAHDRRDPDTLGRHYCELHVVQVEGGVLHVDKSCVETSEPDQFDNLRVGDAADMGSQGEAAFAQDPLDPVLLHVRSLGCC
jgi:hypothetical protein